MISSRTWRLLIIFVIGAFLLLEYQNCAPAPLPGAKQGKFKHGNESLPVSIIDDTNSSLKLSFIEREIRLTRIADGIHLDGICLQDQDGATLRWELQDNQGQMLKEGWSQCDLGGFTVDFVSAQELTCGATYHVFAQLGEAERGQVDLTRNCDN